MNGERKTWMVVSMGFLVLIAGTWLVVNRSFTDERDTDGPGMITEPPAVTFALSSPAFEDGGMIPSRYTCDADDIAPSLQIAGAPEGAQSFALIMDDPDAGGFLHWVLFNIPADTTEIGPTGSIGVTGLNGWGSEGYRGPCPPSGEHRYFFKLYALDIALGLSSGATRDEVEQAMQGHILGEAQLIGRYERK